MTTSSSAYSKHQPRSSTKHRQTSPKKPSFLASVSLSALNLACHGLINRLGANSCLGAPEVTPMAAGPTERNCLADHTLTAGYPEDLGSAPGEPPYFHTASQSLIWRYLEPLVIRLAKREGPQF